MVAAREGVSMAQYQNTECRWYLGNCMREVGGDHAQILLRHVTGFSAGVNPYPNSLLLDIMHSEVLVRHGLVAVLLE